MDKKKANKEEKIGSDGLTKKERRALKVQAKQTDDNKAELKINQKNKESSEVEPEKNIGLAGEVMEISSEKNDTLSEKQKRKLEWEKKQAEQAKNTDKNEFEGLSKAEIKAKRREIQESQRMAKLKAEEEKKNKSKKTEVSNTEIGEKQPSLQPSDAIVDKVADFQHASFISQFLSSNSLKPVEEMYPPVVEDIPSAFVVFGTLYASGCLAGPNEKTVKFIIAIESTFQSLEVPSGETFCKYLETTLDRCVIFLQKHNHISFGILNVLKSFKTFLTQLDETQSKEVIKEQLSEFLDIYIQDQIVKAGQAISLKAKENVYDKDVILVYGWSHTIFNILVDIHKEGKKDICVVIVDSRPFFDGEEMLKKLSAAGINHKYVMIHSLCHLMPMITKVLLEADALLNNGYVMSKAGTAQIARMAQFFDKKVLVCCETYKFTDTVLVDAMGFNELGRSELLLEYIEEISPIQSKDKSKSTIFNLLYDVTPSDLVTAVLTELAILASHTVPVVLRQKPHERY